MPTQLYKKKLTTQKWSMLVKIILLIWLNRLNGQSCRKMPTLKIHEGAPPLRSTPRQKLKITGNVVKYIKNRVFGIADSFLRSS